MTNTHSFDVDVLVAGGGVAGVSAALSAARSGLRTLLLESQISLGGLATNGYVTGIAGAIEGNCKEWLDRLEAEGGLYKQPHLPTIDPEKGKIMLENMLLEAGARILYGTYVTDALVEDNNIQSVICYSKSGRMSISTRIAIDATGDADLAAYAGVPYEVGSAQFAGLNMSTTLVFRMANVNLVKYEAAAQEWHTKNTEHGKLPNTMSLIGELQGKAIDNGDLPYLIFPTALLYRVPQTPDEDADITVTTTHSFYAHTTDAKDLSRQVIEQHQQVAWMEKFLKKYVPGFEKSRVTGLANQLGVRDSRRIVGEYILKDEDIFCSKKFEDGIAQYPEYTGVHHPTSPRMGFVRHIHLKEPKTPAICIPAQCSDDMNPFVKVGGYMAYPNRTEYAEIPYRSLVPLKIDNLLVAGRCVSVEFFATAATRIIATAMSMGQAAGVGAGLCLEKGITPRELDGKLVREMLIEQGVPLDKDQGYWSTVRQQAKEMEDLKGEYVVFPGDFLRMRTPDGRLFQS